MLLKNGDSSIVVSYLQYGLHIMCCSPNGFDGVFGAGTEAAVIKFQQKMGLDADGVVGDGTWNSLCSEISIIQRALSNKGYFSSSIDGIAGEETYNAVVAFQNANGLSADGQVGSATRVVLMREGSTEVTGDDFPMQVGSSGDNVIYLQYGLHILCCSPGSIDGVFGEGTEAAVIKFQTKYSLGADGIVGTGTWSKMQELITEIQQALVNNGYSVGVVDGVAGEATYSQVMAFQADHGLIADGQVGPSTSEALGTSSPGSSSSDATDNFPLSIGSSGPYVLYVQYALYINCINPNGVDGTFGEGTKAAVEKFQSQNGLTVDGIVTTEVWEAMRNIILPIQQALNNHGYDTGGIDGIAGEQTYNAIIAFQQANGLSSDGQVGPSTMAALQGEGSGMGGTVSSTLSQGSNGSLTRYLQHLLDALGYDVDIDGIFGTTTYEAVVEFQNDHGLDADGVVGGGTWSALFSTYKVPVTGDGISRFVMVAQHELSWGFAEDNANNITPYGQWYGMQDAWCAMFVSYCAYQAGILGSVVPMFAYCPYGVDWYRNQGRFYSRDGGYTPRMGDTIFYFNAATNEISHTGIVVGVSDTSVTTIEGNSSDKVCSHVYDRNNTYIYGYGSNGGTDDTVVDPPTISEADKLAELRKKCIQLLKSMGLYSSEYTLTLNEEIPLVNTENLRISFIFANSHTIYTNTEDASCTFEVVNGEAISSSINIMDFLNGGIDIEIDNDTNNLLSNLFLTVGNGNGKLVMSTDGVWFNVSYIIESQFSANEVVNQDYSFELKVSVKSENSSGNPPVYTPEMVEEEGVKLASPAETALLIFAIGAAIKLKKYISGVKVAATAIIEFFNALGKLIEEASLSFA